jgi:hypothetical protein
MQSKKENELKRREFPTFKHQVEEEKEPLKKNATTGSERKGEVRECNIPHSREEKVLRKEQSAIKDAIERSNKMTEKYPPDLIT